MIKDLDHVELLVSVLGTPVSMDDHRGLVHIAVGSLGTVVFDYGGGQYEVEFIDDDLNLPVLVPLGAEALRAVIDA